MERLHAPVHHFGYARDVGDADDGQPRRLQRARGAAGGDELPSRAGER